ncbi:DUF3040 domain-containing protein [Streptomyces sp. NPDC059698]|uniref:DUF3040 domain-containing protein n=1 Tax=unclassified Streptomyces TaxID=2593676 RepID=UPI00093D49AF|nr:DUF3040 domain-containing protein [Streptomyces sp. CB02366]OKJ35487.1 hypothetical protein AMK24_20125 [Streptomyces sp. CB02366]TVP33929.1 hypothetical protein A3L22_15595 [Streptomyces griseus subsp. griseus]WSS58786.1 DUF3040 domain-containing protein [Streptomyces sp. NBC_01178]
MPTYDERLRELEEQLRHDDPGFAEAMSGGVPRPPREYRRRNAWLWLLVGLAALGAGIGAADGLLIAAGLVVSGAAAHLFDPQRGRPQGRDVPGAR